MPSIYSRMFQKLKDRRYRKAFIAAQVRRIIPMQLRALRDSRGMTQQRLARKAHTTQTVISRIEKGGGGRNLTIKSLLNLADALDVALVIRFEPIDQYMTWVENLSAQAIAPQASDAILKQMEVELALLGAAGSKPSASGKISDLLGTPDSKSSTPAKVLGGTNK